MKPEDNFSEIPPPFSEAVEYARSELAFHFIKDGRFKPFGKQRLEELYHRAACAIVENEETYFEATKTDQEAFDAMREAATRYMERGWELPRNLRGWIGGYLRGDYPRPGKTGSLEDRMKKRAIAGTVEILVSYGMTATRNEASTRESACDAVAEALKELGQQPSTYDGVRKIFYGSGSWCLWGRDQR